MTNVIVEVITAPKNFNHVKENSVCSAYWILGSLRSEVPHRMHRILLTLNMRSSHMNWAPFSVQRPIVIGFELAFDGLCFGDWRVFSTRAQTRYWLFDRFGPDYGTIISRWLTLPHTNGNKTSNTLWRYHTDGAKNWWPPCTGQV